MIEIIICLLGIIMGITEIILLIKYPIGII
jgi:hypothetical protein